MRKISFLLVLILLFTSLCGTAATAAEARASQYFDTYGVSCTKISSGKIKFTFHITGVEESSLIGVSNYYVQKRNDDGSYTSVTDALSGSVARNSISHAFSKYYTGTPGEVYRVKVIFVCDNSKGYATKEYNSVGCTAPN